ncbi:hypothetical protein Daus18300_010442 [Diaporthe australafricana]|uniref:Orc1-like AAA ATPase domain-containing protein n=1 Tax=Diaporthe australafricana TaxID=127596 RepID=A0ABR3WA97_9PEZI
MYRTRRIERLVISLYIKHAKFFCHFMTWYSSSSRRFTTSLRTDFYSKEVKQRVKEIRDVAKEVEREASLCTQLCAQRTGRRVQLLPTTHESVQIAEFYHDKTVQYIDKCLEIWAQNIGQQCQVYTVDFIENRMYRAEVSDAKKLNAHRHSILNRSLHLPEEPELGIADSSSQEASGMKHLGVAESVPCSNMHTRAGLEEACRSLQKYLVDLNSGEEDGGGMSAPSASAVSGLIVIRLKDWMASPKSDFLWIVGLTFPYDNEARRATQHIKQISREARLPCVSFSADVVTVAPEHPEERQTRQMALLVAMLYSLVQQLSTFVPSTFEDSYDLEGAVQQLDGRKMSLQKALEVIGVLLRHRTPLLLVILDGLDQLDDDETTPYLRELFEILHGKGPDSRLKVLLGSQGYLLSGANFEVEEQVDCAMLPKMRGGRARPDGRLLSEIDSIAM